jgi:hypothetical protein
LKIRNQLLRALPSYRSCPKCSERNSNDEPDATGYGGGGGGFVTPECLGPHYEERRATATQLLKGTNAAILAIGFAYFILVFIISRTPCETASVDLFFMLLPIYIFVKAALAAQYFLATIARQHFFRPITVECPCCDESFVLPAESKHLQDDETSRWMDAHTRPCPSCSVPIVKSGGCNHMRCSHCGADFCWACMSLRTSCRAYQCSNGAPYRNAVPEMPVQDDRRSLQPNDSILTVIDYILERRYATVDYLDGIVLLLCFFGRYSSTVQFFVKHIMAALSVMIGQTIPAAVTSLIIIIGYRSQRTMLPQHALLQHQQHRGAENFIQPQHLNRRQLRRLEQDMVREAIRRSMEEL